MTQYSWKFDLNWTAPFSIFQKLKILNKFIYETKILHDTTIVLKKPYKKSSLFKNNETLQPRDSNLEERILAGRTKEMLN